jgi:hypothetical protein
MPLVMQPRISKTFFERYRRAKFPNDLIASNVLKSLGIPQDRVQSALEILKTNGRYAGIIRDTPTGRQCFQCWRQCLVSLVRDLAFWSLALHLILLTAGTNSRCSSSRCIHLQCRCWLALASVPYFTASTDIALASLSDDFQGNRLGIGPDNHGLFRINLKQSAIGCGEFCVFWPTVRVATLTGLEAGFFSERIALLEGFATWP